MVTNGVSVVVSKGINLKNWYGVFFGNKAAVDFRFFTGGFLFNFINFALMMSSSNINAVSIYYSFRFDFYRNQRVYLSHSPQCFHAFCNLQTSSH